MSAMIRVSWQALAERKLYAYACDLCRIEPLEPWTLTTVSVELTASPTPTTNCQKLRKQCRLRSGVIGV